MAAQRDIQCIFQLLHEPVNKEEMGIENIERFICCGDFLLLLCVLIFGI